MKTIAFVALLTVLFASLFRLGGADLTNNVLGVALMVLLSSLFSDLKEFNFWGLKGVAKEEQKLKNLKGADSISPSKHMNIPPAKIQQAVRQDTVVLMDNDRGNFLALAFDIERLLRIIAALVAGPEAAAGTNPSRVVELLQDNGVLTDAGRAQVESIRWLRNMLVQGRENELSHNTLRDGIEIAYDFYTSLKGWLDMNEVSS